MTRRTLLVGLLIATFAAAGSGCGFPSLHCRGGPYGTLAGRNVGYPCNSCHGAGCEYCAAQNPRAHLRQTLGCGSGCGEIYWDEWVSDPPDCSDPCDHYGHWTGYPGSLYPRGSQFWRNLWGYRFSEASYGACLSCGHAHGAINGRYPAGAEEIPAGAVIISSQTTSSLAAPGRTIAPQATPLPHRSVLKAKQVNATAERPYYVPQSGATRAR